MTSLKLSNWGTSKEIVSCRSVTDNSCFTNYLKLTVDYEVKKETMETTASCRFIFWVFQFQKCHRPTSYLLDFCRDLTGWGFFSAFKFGDISLRYSDLLGEPIFILLMLRPPLFQVHTNLLLKIIYCHSQYMSRGEFIADCYLTN